VALTAQQSREISEVLGRKVTQPCPVCGQHQTWSWSSDLIMLQSHRYETVQEYFGPLGYMPPPLPPARQQLEILKSIAGGPESPPPVYPTLPVMCSNCGNTVLLNVYVLGIAHIWPDIASARMG